MAKEEDCGAKVSEHGTDQIDKEVGSDAAGQEEEWRLDSLGWGFAEVIDGEALRGEA